MSTLLNSASALKPGNDLWIVPDKKNSKWSKKLDWYLNFQMLKHERNKSPDLDPELANILKASGLPEFQTNLKSDSPLMISAPNLLPSKWFIVIPYSENTKDWVEKIQTTWKGLNHPSFRIFLPQGVQVHEFQQQWEKKNEFQDYSCVLD